MVGVVSASIVVIFNSVLLQQAWFSMEASIRVRPVVYFRKAYMKKKVVDGGELEGEKVLCNFTLPSFPRFEGSGVGREE